MDREEVNGRARGGHRPADRPSQQITATINGWPPSPSRMEGDLWLRPWITRSVWEASVTTWIEGGQQMAELAASVKGFLTQA